jgi:mannitol/fructose-specific phosphotransferase system IIA component (Ntr-type)
MTVNLSDLLNPACIELNLKSKKKPDVLKELTAVIARRGSIGDLDKLYEELLKRKHWPVPESLEALLFHTV